MGWVGLWIQRYIHARHEPWSPMFVSWYPFPRHGLSRRFIDCDFILSSMSILPTDHDTSAYSYALHLSRSNDFIGSASGVECLDIPYVVCGEQLSCGHFSTALFSVIDTRVGTASRLTFFFGGDSGVLSDMVTMSVAATSSLLGHMVTILISMCLMHGRAVTRIKMIENQKSILRTANYRRKRSPGTEGPRCGPLL